jgi:pimeloyl-ACP methyl ester carboxylesterase
LRAPAGRIDDTGVRLLAIVVALLVLGALYQAIERRRRRFTPPGRMIDVGGHRLHANCIGSGSPLVVLESGIAASSLSWAIVQPRIAKLTSVCAYDRAGLGWSDAPSRRTTFDGIVNELATVLADVAANQRCILVGHSFGSFVVQAYAVAHPRRVAGIVLVDPPVEWLTETARRAQLLRGGRHLSRVGAWLARVGVVRLCLNLLTGGAPGVPRRFVRIFGPTAARTLERLVGEVRKLPSDVHPVVQAMWCEPKCFHAMGDHLLTLARDRDAMAAARPDPHIPRVVISSADQPAEELAAHQALAEGSTNGRHVVATRSAHWVQFDEPELVVEAVERLVELERSRQPRPDLDATPSAGA